jgi:hypothetical protein
MRNEKRFTLISPPPGFTARVMVRLAEQERAQARRAWAGSALLVATAVATLGLIAWWLVSWIGAFVAMPQLIIVIIDAFATLAFWTATLAEVIWNLALILVDDSGVPMFSLALLVLALTIVWVRVVTGSLQPIPQKQNVGGLQ